MDWLADLRLGQFLVFVLVLLRLSGLVITAPIFGSREVPARIRALVAVALALVVTPTQVDRPPTMPDNVIELARLAGSEIVLGLALGLGVMVLFSSVQLTGQVLSQMAGVQLADVFNPSFDASVPVYSELLYILAMTMFLAVGGQRWLLAGVLETFHTVPLGSTLWAESLGTALQLLTAQSFDLAIRMAAPTAAALLMATLVLGLVSRTLPQLNIMAVGFGINITAALGVLAVSLGTMMWVFSERIEPTLIQLFEGLGG